MSYVDDRDRIVTRIAYQMAKRWLVSRGAEGEGLREEIRRQSVYFLTEAGIIWDEGLAEQGRIEEEKRLGG